jgi:hypothetical protein
MVMSLQCEGVRRKSLADVYHKAPNASAFSVLGALYFEPACLPRVERTAGSLLARLYAGNVPPSPSSLSSPPFR